MSEANLWEDYEWTKHDLTEPVDEILFDPNIFRLTKAVSKESENARNRAEQGGVFGGVVEEGKFYVFRNTAVGYTKEGYLVINPWDANKDENILVRRLTSKMPNYRCVLYHAHPRITAEILKEIMPDGAEDMIQFIERDIEEGVFDYLRTEGREVNLDSALNEVVSRELSEEDLINTPGNYHLLISPTSSESNETSHLNFYRIGDYPKKLKSGRFDYNKSRNLRDAKSNYERIIRKFNRDRFGFSRITPTTDSKLIERARHILWAGLDHEVRE